MKVFFRILVTFVTAVGAYFVFWVGGALLLALDVPPWVSLVGSLTAAILVGRYVWTHTASMQAGLISSIMVGAFATGGIGFAGGFFGPIIFAPGSNQGPLLGIFITGPLGFLLGAVGGAVYWFRWGRRHVSVVRGNTAG